MQKSPRVDLSRFDNRDFGRGQSRTVEALWLLVQALALRSWVPGTSHRRLLLRLFGARLGIGLGIKPGVRVKFPWRLTVGDYSWIGEDVWIDNLAMVRIGAHCCISQGAYLCTGNHDWGDPAFSLIVRPITIADCAWVGARAVVAPGVKIGEGAVLGMGSVATDNLEPWTVYSGVPAVAVRPRIIVTPP